MQVPSPTERLGKELRDPAVTRSRAAAALR